MTVRLRGCVCAANLSSKWQSERRSAGLPFSSSTQPSPFPREIGRHNYDRRPGGRTRSRLVLKSTA
jgi:hypothetical protein